MGMSSSSPLRAVAHVTAAYLTDAIASLLSATAQTAHKAFASLAAASPLKAGDAVPDVEVKVNNMEEKLNFSKLTGKNVLVLVPGAYVPPISNTGPCADAWNSFSPACSDQVPGYIAKYDEYKTKGVKDIYIVAINDMFVMQAWRKKLLSENGKEGQETSTVKFGE